MNVSFSDVPFQSIPIKNPQKIIGLISFLTSFRKVSTNSNAPFPNPSLPFYTSD
jgi:hypothetical protein